ncbi:MAG: hypothetical protein WCD11_25190 [Solirubrobacteraceae bacterium]
MVDLGVDRGGAQLLVAQTWPISASEQPALSIRVAAVWRSRCAPACAIPAREQAAVTIEPTAIRVSGPPGGSIPTNTARDSLCGR